LKKIETSSSWVEFLKELEVKCKEQEISLSDLVEWIRALLEQIERRTFAFHIASGPNPEFMDQKIDANILLDNVLHGFTVSKDKREYNLVPLKFKRFQEQIYGDFASERFGFGEMAWFSITDKKENLDKLREFTRQVMKIAWET